MKTKKFWTLVAVMLAVTGVIMLCPVLISFSDGADVAFCLVAYYMIFPLAMFTCGCFSGQTGYQARALMIILAALLGLVLPVTLLGSTKVITGVFGLLASLLGVVISSVIESTRKN